MTALDVELTLPRLVVEQQHVLSHLDFDVKLLVNCNIVRLSVSSVVSFARPVRKDRRRY